MEIMVLLLLISRLALNLEGQPVKSGAGLFPAVIQSSALAPPFTRC
jgi:hypothetical protein